MLAFTVLSKSMFLDTCSCLVLPEVFVVILANTLILSLVRIMCDVTGLGYLSMYKDVE